MKEEEPVDGKKSEDDGIEKENLAILEKIRKNQRQDHLNVSAPTINACVQRHPCKQDVHVHVRARCNLRINLIAALSIRFNPKELKVPCK